MSEELAMKTLAYLVTHYKEHDETIINSEEIQAIEFLQQENERLKNILHNITVSGIENDKTPVLDLINERNLYKSVIDEVREFVKENKGRYIYQDGMGADWYYEDLTVYDELLEILDKVKESE